MRKGCTLTRFGIIFVGKPVSEKEELRRKLHDKIYEARRYLRRKLR